MRQRRFSHILRARFSYQRASQLYVHMYVYNDRGRHSRDDDDGVPIM
jgi:hypothetical protein